MTAVQLIDPRRIALDILLVGFKSLARLRMPVLAALALRLMTRRVVRRNHRGPGRIYNIVMLPKDAFDEDVASSLGKSQRFQIYAVRRIIFKGLALGFLPHTVDDNYYVSDELAMVEGKARYRAFLAKMWRVYERLLRVDGMVTGNFGYYAERELASMLEERGIPFIAMHKENMKSPGRKEWYTAVYRDRRGPFTGRRILVYNEAERSVQIGAGVVAPERISVCGMPRLDRVHEWRRRHAGTRGGGSMSRIVLLFSFTEKTGLPRLRRKRRAGFANGQELLEGSKEAMAWKRLFRETHRAVLQLAAEDPEVTVIVKSKQGRRDWVPLAAALGAGADLPRNVKVVRGGDPLEMITAAAVVVGFNTTGILEAMAAGKPVVVPWFAEVLDPEMRPYAMEFDGAVELARSAQDLQARLLHHLRSPAEVPVRLSPESVRALEHWCGNADGASGERICRAVESEVAGRLQPRQRRANRAHA